ASGDRRKEPSSRAAVAFRENPHAKKKKGRAARKQRAARAYITTLSLRRVSSSWEWITHPTDAQTGDSRSSAMPFVSRAPPVLRLTCTDHRTKAATCFSQSPRQLTAP